MNIAVSFSTDSTYKQNIHCSKMDRDSHCFRVRRLVPQQPPNRSDYLLIIPPMALEATLGTASLLQLVEALSLNAERVGPIETPPGLGASFDPNCRSVTN